jgi:E3 ubiquitin-protein ligase HECTD2
MSADPTMQRRILFFITGSDRVPATGMSNMAFKITCIGNDCER